MLFITSTTDTDAREFDIYATALSAAFYTVAKWFFDESWWRA
jgi:hypothetical protein